MIPNTHVGAVNGIANASPQRSIPPYRCWAEVNIGAIQRNIHRIKASLPQGIKIFSVVKADAQGHGLPQVVQANMRTNIYGYAVANAHEGEEVRAIDPHRPILILGALLKEEEPLIIRSNLTPTLSSVDEVEQLTLLGKQHNTKIPVHIKIDTGMGRLGVWHEDAESLFDDIYNNTVLDIKGIYTHLANAEEDPEFTTLQRQLFIDTLSKYKAKNDAPLLIHADNSAGICSFEKESFFNAARIGIAQNGEPSGNPAPMINNKLEATLSLHGKVCHLKSLPQGVTVSYGCTYKLKRPSKIALIGVGYADGIPTALSNNGFVLIREQRCPIIGRVTMDQTLVDVTDLEEIRKGDIATFFGQQGNAQISMLEMASWASTLHREIMCTLTKRVPRVYIH